MLFVFYAVYKVDECSDDNSDGNKFFNSKREIVLHFSKQLIYNTNKLG